MDIDPKRTGVKAILLTEFRFDANPGDCLWHEDLQKLSFACPGCAKWGGVRCSHPKPSQSPSWDIVSGIPKDPATLSLSPSIHCVGCCGWHGYLTNGVFVSC